ncbi:BTAD domain-containing putative transcriptional regulator [Streptomyces sp. NPDC052114]|uniref:AfsR/SARP family transcriptional regulator n=1 Tax=unclassified Streptomyces TaxID=2593676 RepID=UPI00341A0E56
MCATSTSQESVGAMQGDELHYALLGPVKVREPGGGTVGLAPQQRAILVMLLSRGGRSVTAAELVDGVWGDPAPERALSTLRTQIARLRRVLEPARPARTPAKVLLSTPGGYRLRIAEGACDLDLFHGHVTAAERAVRDGDPHAARRLFGAALDLWRGEPLAGVPGPYADTLRAALAERRLAALEARVRLDLELGAPAESIPELTLLVAEHPLREGLRAQLMLALYRGGRQGEALAAYADVRRVLGEELGVEPGPELRDMHRRVLRADPSLGGTEGAAPVGFVPVPTGSAGADEAAAADYHVPTPAQLPAPPADFTGRTEDVERLLAALATDRPQVVVSAMAGLGGVGKTVLALYAGHRARDRYPDGQLYADLGGASAVPVDPADLLARFLRALGIGVVPDGLDERAALYRSVLAGRRVLVVLDNAASAGQVAPLLPGTPGSAALVTSRARLPLPSAHAFELDVFTEDEALELLAGIVGADRVEAEPEAAAALVAACARLPLAVRIVGARLGQRPSWRIAGLVGRLADERRRLVELRVGSMAVEATFRLGYDQLAPPLARAFRLAALIEGPVFAAPMAAAVLDSTEQEAETLLERLVDEGLLEARADGGYRYHDLLRLFARAQTEETGETGGTEGYGAAASGERHRGRAEAASGEEDRGRGGGVAVEGDRAGEGDAAVARLVDHCLAVVRGAHRLARPGSTTPDDLAPTRAVGLPFEDATAGQDWVRHELDTLLALLREAADRPGVPIGPAADLLLALDPFAESDFLWPRLNGPAAALADAAAVRGDTSAEIRARYMLGGGLWQVGREEEGREHASRALELSRTTGDEVLLGQLLNIAGLLVGRGHEVRLALFREGVAVHARRGNLWGELETLSNTAQALRGLGRAEEALDCLNGALDRARPLGWTLVRVYLQGSHARTLAQLGHPADAVASYTEALAGCRAVGSVYLELLLEQGLGETERARGRTGQAAAHLERSLAGARRIGNEPMQATVLLELSRTLAEAGHAGRAEACLRAARDLHLRLGLPLPLR